MRPLNVTTQAAYSIGDDQSGHRRFVTTMTDPNGNVTTQYADYGGRKVQVTDSINGATRTTLMHYDNLGQLDSVSDPEGFKTTYSYDMLGRMTKRIHPDAGETRYTYDNAGNLTKEINPLGQILYDYTYYRLLKKRYSSMTGNDVTYTYGTSGTETGRPVRIVDGSGMYECRYDALGNVTDETRTIALPQHGEVYRFRTSYQYDSWGRMLSMTYPDGEEVAYTYLWGGDLYSMHGTKGANHRVYVSKILYNTFGQRSQVEYGNRTKAYYTYDALHRLANLKSRDGGGTLMQDIDYTYDNASNVTGIANSAGVVNTLGGAYGNSYQYDALHRLISSTGGGAVGNYNTNLTYSPSGRLIGKYRVNNPDSLSGAVDMAYGYCDNHQPHAVRRIYDYQNLRYFDFRWDGAGNLGQVSAANENAIFESGRFLYWTEDSRMHAAVDDRYYSYYAYDHCGERRLKLTGDNKLLDVNADFMATYTILNEHTLYPSAYMVLTNRGYTKHYYAGAERLAARLGGGGLNAMGNAIGYSDTLLAKADTLFDQSLEQVNSRALNGNDIDCILGNGFAKEEFGHPIDGIPCQMQAGVDFFHDPFKDMVHSMLDDSHNGQEREVYFYHSDHLGSASWITDSGGQAIQHLQYLPYGEPYINQRTSGYCERFTFTGKEKDEETGYGYFGARYMDHELMTMWLSVDPMSDKYPSISPYNYCMWNPMKIVDEYGMEADIPPLLAKFCSAERQANSFLNNPKRKGRFVRNTISSIDADGRETITVKPNSNYADKYDAPSPSDGILLPTVYVTDNGLGKRDFTDGDIYHFFHNVVNRIRHFENKLEGGNDGANYGLGCGWEPRNYGIGVDATVCLGIGAHIQFGIYCDNNGFWNNYFGIDFCMGYELGVAGGATYTPDGISGPNSSLSADYGFISMSINSKNANAPFIGVPLSKPKFGVGTSWQKGYTWSWLGR